MKQNSKHLIALGFVSLLTGVLHAGTINFEDRTGPISFPQNPVMQTLVYSNIGGSGISATLTGGFVLKNTFNLPADESTVYGTAFGAATGINAGLSNPLTVTFSQNITGFSLDLYNGLNSNVQYVVSDNLGNSLTSTLSPNLSSGNSRIGFAAAGDVVTIAAVGSNFDFFIDNITFDQSLIGTPEPCPLALLGSGLVLIALIHRRSTRGNCGRSSEAGVCA
jgi:hypothetical protein